MCSMKLLKTVFEHPRVEADFAKWNAIIFAINMLPQYEYMGKGKPPATVADFKGKRLRALGGMGRSAKKDRCGADNGSSVRDV